VSIKYIELCPLLAKLPLKIFKQMKYKYEMIFFWSKSDNIYIVEVPELSGCKSDGKIYLEAVHNIQ